MYPLYVYHICRYQSQDTQYQTGMNTNQNYWTRKSHQCASFPTHLPVESSRSDWHGMCDGWGKTRLTAWLVVTGSKKEIAQAAHPWLALFHS